VDSVSIIFLNFLVLDFLILNCGRDFGNINGVKQISLYIAGLLFNLINGLSRLFWGFLLDKLKFKKLMFLITILEIIVGFSLYFIVKIEVIYIIELLLVAICIGGSLSILSPTFVEIYGLFLGPEIYGLTGISISLSGLLGPVLISLMAKFEYNYLYTFLIGGGLCVIKLIALILFDENEKMYDDNNDAQKKINYEMTDTTFPVDENE
jgi:MFS family permease